MQKKSTLLILTLGLLLIPLVYINPETVSAAPDSNVTDDQPTLNFPDSITFRATIENSAPITSVVLEYGTNELTCGDGCCQSLSPIHTRHNRQRGMELGNETVRFTAARSNHLVALALHR